MNRHCRDSWRGCLLRRSCLEICCRSCRDALQHPVLFALCCFLLERSFSFESPISLPAYEIAGGCKTGQRLEDCFNRHVDRRSTRLTFGKNVIDYAVSLCFLRSHVIVSLAIVHDLLKGFSAIISQFVCQHVFEPQYFFGVNLYVGCLPLKPS